MINKIKAMELRLSGWTYERIAQHFNLSRQRIHQILTEYYALGEGRYREKALDREYRNSPEYQNGQSKRRKLYQRNLNRTIKTKVLTHYGKNKLACTNCGFDNIKALSIDHINGKGSQHRKSTGQGGAAFYRWLMKGDYPKGYQTLCMNCQWIKRVDNLEYHS